MKHKPFTKAISLLLLFTFGYSQLIYAADVTQMIADAKALFELENQKKAEGGVSAAQLVQSQSQQQSVIDQQQALQDLQNNNNPVSSDSQFSLTTQNGDVLSYVGNKLNEVTRPDGTILNNITTDSLGNIQNANLKLSDGSI